ncbi:MAG: putative glycoside hydrolase [Gemmatimonadota bacterium]
MPRLLQAAPWLVVALAALAEPPGFRAPDEAPLADGGGVAPARAGQGLPDRLGELAPLAADTAVVVRPGESLSSIADRLLAASDAYTSGQLMGRIRTANALRGDHLTPGQSLRVPLANGEAPPRVEGAPGSPFAARGLYLTAGMAGSAAGLALADSLVAAGGNTVVFDIKDRPGDLSYGSQIPMARAIGACSLATIRRPRTFVDLLHRRGLHVVARLTCFHDRRLAAARPDLVPRSGRDGGLWREHGVLGWVDPSLPEVQDYLLDIAAEVAAFGVDEIQLDYIRFPAEGEVADAVYAFEPAVVAKHQVITGFVARVRQTLIGTGVQLSADIFGVAAWGRDVDVQITGQYLPDLLPLLDVASPMLYPSHFQDGFQEMEAPPAYPYQVVAEGCQRLRSLAAAHDVVIRPWVQSFAYRVSGFDADYVVEQVRGAEAGGATGWLLWNASSQYDEGLAAIRALRRSRRQ